MAVPVSDSLAAMLVPVSAMVTVTMLPVSVSTEVTRSPVVDRARVTSSLVEARRSTMSEPRSWIWSIIVSPARPSARVMASAFSPSEEVTRMPDSSMRRASWSPASAIWLATCS